MIFNNLYWSLQFINYN